LSNKPHQFFTQIEIADTQTSDGRLASIILCAVFRIRFPFRQVISWSKTVLAIEYYFK